jgi:hypothetical protein
VRGYRHVPSAFYPRERPGTHCTRGWVDPRAGLDKCGKSRPHRDSIPGPSSPWPVAIPTELPGPPFIYLRKETRKSVSLNRPTQTLGNTVYSHVHVLTITTIQKLSDTKSVLKPALYVPYDSRQSHSDMLCFRNDKKRWAVPIFILMTLYLQTQTPSLEALAIKAHEKLLEMGTLHVSVTVGNCR